MFADRVSAETMRANRMSLYLRDGLPSGQLVTAARLKALAHAQVSMIRAKLLKIGPRRPKRHSHLESHGDHFAFRIDGELTQ